MQSNRMNWAAGVLCVSALVLSACGSGGNSGTPLQNGGGSTNGTGTTGGSTVVNSAVAKISLTPDVTTILADGTTASTITVKALNAGNAVVPGATINFAVTGGGELSAGAGNITTDATTGLATVKVTAPVTDQNNRALTVRASCQNCLSGADAQTVITVKGANIAAVLASNSSAVGAAPVAVTATVKSAKGDPLGGVAVNFVSSDSSVATLSSATATTNGQGVATVTIKPMTQGNVFVTAKALGAESPLPFQVTPSSLQFTSPAAGSVATINTPQTFTVSSSAATVTFASTMGTFSNGQGNMTVNVSNGQASVTLTSALGGMATVNATDSNGSSANFLLAISPPVSAANKIDLTANQTTVPMATSKSSNAITITAKVLASDGSTSQPVVGVPVALSMSGGPGMGEYLTPAQAVSDATGIVTATFYAGTGASNYNGIRVTASIPGRSPAVVTGTSPSSNDVLLTVGGQALSVAFSSSSKVASVMNDTAYQLDYGVIVSDANGNPVPNAVVTLNMRPFAFSTGPACQVRKTYCSEDKNNNGSLDVGEDGARLLLSNSTASIRADQCNANAWANNVGTLGDIDQKLTPQKSDAGALPAQVTTDNNGTALFKLTYLKGSALWVLPMITATVQANGTESSNSVLLRLPVSESDMVVDPITGAVTKCYLPPSPYRD